MAKICCSNKRKRLFVFVSLVIVCLDFAFVGLNYISSKSALYTSLVQQLKGHQQSFNITTEMTYSTMLQMASFISKYEDYNQLFLMGKKAVEAEGGNVGGEKAQQAREALLKKIQAGWNEMSEKFGVRQLHYHLGPGSLSFLRVHKPNKFGDRMDTIRYTVVDTNAEKKARTGFETGRVYSGLRGVVPIWATDPETSENVYVGALEAGTSFRNVLKIMSNLNIGIGILLDNQHVKKNMWEAQVIKVFGNSKTSCNCFVEQTNRTGDIEEVLQKIELNENYSTNQVQLIKLNGNYHAAYYFPLRDYYGDRHPEAPHAGFVLLWSNVTEAVKEFQRNSLINISFSLLGFCIVEAVLIAALKIETNFRRVEHLATLDGLTSLPNRRNFDMKIVEEIGRCKRYKHSVALVMCDIDYFKQYNDTYGHLLGDDCLKKVAQILRTQLKRSIDYVARYGGEEFVIILPNTSLEEAIYVTDKIRKAVIAEKIPHSGSKVSQYVSMSFGVAVLKPQKNIDDNPINLIRKADHFLYMAKEQGRNQVCPTGKV